MHLPSLKLTGVLIILLAALYPMLIAGVAKMAPGGGDGVTVSLNGKVVGYANIGQKFTDPKYFWGRPSAVDYNAAGSGGSNKGASQTPITCQQFKQELKTLLVYNPGIDKSQFNLQT